MSHKKLTFERNNPKGFNRINLIELSNDLIPDNTNILLHNDIVVDWIVLSSICNYSLQYNDSPDINKRPLVITINAYEDYPICKVKNWIE